MIGLLSEYLFVLGAKGKAFWESDTSINLFICNIGSYFLSSSKDLNVANEFSNCGIIIVGWVPKVDSNYQLIRYTDIYSKHEEIE